MDEKFTPGPWQVQYEQLSPASEKRGFTIVTESFDVVSGFLAIRREADAQIISAAPDLYEYLLYAVESVSLGCMPNTEWLKHASSVLRKSRGEDGQNRKTENAEQPFRRA